LKESAAEERGSNEGKVLFNTCDCCSVTFEHGILSAIDQRLEEIYRCYLFYSWFYSEGVGWHPSNRHSIHSNGLDPHEWEPSAKDIETINNADLVVENGLGLEGGMRKLLS